jgi:dipeptidyl aminopeptidase/acylaminoacyl peptidase
MEEALATGEHTGILRFHVVSSLAILMASLRNRVAGQWGVVDVEDCVSAVKELASHDLIDSSRVGIRGESAGKRIWLSSESR